MLTRRGGAVALALVVAACSSGDPAATPTTQPASVGSDSTTTTTAPERPASTTTTGYDPASIEGQVEAAYLRSWDVYAEAVYNLQLDEAALAEVYAEHHLATKRTEIQKRSTDQRAASVVVEHDYTIQFSDPATAILIDRFRNHQVLIDPSTKQPVEPDPDAVVVDVVTLRLFGTAWKVTRKERLN